MANKIKRRKQQRIEVRWPITVFTGQGTIEGKTRDIAVNGMHICCEEALPLNEIFRMSIMPPNHQAIGVTGKVIWSDFYAIDEENTTLGMGVCFVKISDGDHHFLKDVVSVHSESSL